MASLQDATATLIRVHVSTDIWNHSREHRTAQPAERYTCANRKHMSTGGTTVERG